MSIIKPSENISILRELKSDLNHIKGELFLVKQELRSIKNIVVFKPNMDYEKIEMPRSAPTQTDIAISKGWFF